MRAVARLATMAVLLMANLHCDRPHVVKWVIPAGFSGRIHVAATPDGQPLPYEDGAYVIKVPVSGELRLREPLPTIRWHVPQAVWADGKPLAYEPKTGVGFFNLGIEQHSNAPGLHLYAFVGTLEQANDARAARGYPEPAVAAEK